MEIEEKAEELQERAESVVVEISGCYSQIVRKRFDDDPGSSQTVY